MEPPRDVRRIRRVLARLHEPGARGGGRSKPPLDRLGGGLLEPGGLAERVRGARTLWSMTSSALASLESEVLEYERWRSGAQLGRGDAELYGLFREYVLHSGQAEGMVDARVAASSAMKRLESTLAQISEELEGVGMRGRARIRRALDVARADLAEIVEALERWLPVEDDAPSFTSDVFHDVERNARDEAVLAGARPAAGRRPRQALLPRTRGGGLRLGRPRASVAASTRPRATSASTAWLTSTRRRGLRPRRRDAPRDDLPRARGVRLRARPGRRSAGPAVGA